MVSSYCIGQHTYRKFPSSQNVLVGSADVDNKKLSLYLKLGNNDITSVFSEGNWQLWTEWIKERRKRKAWGGQFQDY